jgi:hypothetical protein
MSEVLIGVEIDDDIVDETGNNVEIFEYGNDREGYDGHDLDGMHDMR